VKLAALMLTALLLAAPASRAVDGKKDGGAGRLPTVWLIGDSTVKNGTKGQVGWGEVIGDLFDPTKAKVENRAIGGRSSRTFLTEGRWDKVLADVQPGDFVIMQFGHNDGGSLTSAPHGVPRASIKGNGDESQEVDNPATKQKETVHTYGWYLRKYLADAKAKGATPIVCSPIPRNMWKDGKVNRASNDYGKWAAEAARQGGAEFIDLNDIIARRYDALGPEKVGKEYFGPTDHTHTTAEGARVNAGCVVEGIRGLKDARLAGLLKAEAPQAAAAPATPAASEHK
jgi:lysophospholipase L1-like esterase